MVIIPKQQSKPNEVLLTCYINNQFIHLIETTLQNNIEVKGIRTYELLVYDDLYIKIKVDGSELYTWHFNYRPRCWLEQDLHKAKNDAAALDVSSEYEYTKPSIKVQSSRTRTRFSHFTTRETRNVSYSTTSWTMYDINL